MIDKFNWFCLAPKDKQFLEQWVSPKGESSVFKQIPMEHLPRVKQLTKQLGVNARVVYRGPRKNQIDPSFTRRADAERFTVYNR